VAHEKGPTCFWVPILVGNEPSTRTRQSQRDVSWPRGMQNKSMARLGLGGRRQPGCQDLQIWCMFKINITNIKKIQHHLRRRLKSYCTRTWVYSSMTSNMESQSSWIFPPAKFQNCCVTFTVPSCFGCVAPKAGYQQGMDGALALCGLFRRKIEFPKLQAW